MNNSLTFLGTGTSQGVPVIGCTCEVCSSSDHKDKRLRTSAFIQWNGQHIVVDSGPDFRYQMLREGIQKLDALLLSHEHNDHIIGIDDIRPFNFMQKGKLNVFANETVSKNLLARFAYVFEENPYPGAPQIHLNTITKDSIVQLDQHSIIPVQLTHGITESMGYRFGNLAYLTDMKTLPQHEYAKLEGIETLVINCLRKEAHFSHLNLEEALEFIEEIKPQQTYLTHISHRFGTSQAITELLPPNVHVAYDRLKIAF